MFNLFDGLSQAFSGLERLAQTDFTSLPTSNQASVSSSSSSSSSLSGTTSSSDDEFSLSSLFSLSQTSESVNRSKRKPGNSLPPATQIAILRRVVEGDLSLFTGIENWDEYTPRQLLIIEFVKRYNKTKDINFMYLIDDVIHLGENPNETIELDPALRISITHRLLLNQTALLDIPLKRINPELDVDHLSNFYSVNPTCMMQITTLVATLLKSSADSALESLNVCSNQMKDDSMTQKTMAARSISGNKGRGRGTVRVHVDPKQVKIPQLQELDKSIKKINTLYVIGKKQVLKKLDQVKSKVPSGRVSDVHAFSVIKFQMNNLYECTRQLQHEMGKLRARFNKALTELTQVENLFRCDSLELSMTISRGKERSTVILSNIEQLDFTLSVLSKSCAAYNERFCSHFQEQQQSLGFAEQLLHTTEKLELSPKELEQLEVERANSQSDSDSEIEPSSRSSLLVESPTTACRPISEISLSRSGSKAGSACLRKAKNKGGKKRGKRKSTQPKTAPIPKLQPVVPSSEPIVQSVVSTSSSSSSSTVSVVGDFQTLRHSYGWSWEDALEGFSQKQMNKVKTPYFKTRIERCKMESIQHLHYSFVGFELLQQAIEKKNWSAVGEILPAFVMDLAIQIEQVLNMSNLVKNKPDMLHHDLMLLTNLTSLDEKLSEPTKKHLEEISVAMMWARYPVNSKRYYSARQMECPPVLKLILQSQQLMRGQSLTEANQKIVIESLFTLYKDHLAASAEVLEILNQTKELAPISEQMISFVDEELQQQLGRVDSQQQEGIKATQSQSSMEISIMEGQLREIYESAKRKPGLKILKIKMKVKECMNHLNRLQQTLTMLSGKPSAHHQAWIFRNYLKVQQVLEGLYQIRALLKGEPDLLTHHLNDYHTLLQDSEEMSRSLMFDFGKQVHYSQSQNSHPKALPLIERLHHLEEVMKSAHDGGFTPVGKSQGRKQPKPLADTLESDDPLPHIIGSSFEVMNMHLEACMREISVHGEQDMQAYASA